MTPRERARELNRKCEMKITATHDNLLDVVRQAGGRPGDFFLSRVREMSAWDLIKVLGLNNIGFVCTKSHACDCKKNECCCSQCPLALKSK